MNKKEKIIQIKFNEWWDKIVANDDNWTTLERSSAYAAWVKVSADLDAFENHIKEECAKVSENLMSKDKMYYNKYIQDKIAKAIRSRSK